MIRSRFICCFLVVLLSNVLTAQFFSIEDIEPGRGTYLAPQTLKNLQWRGDLHEVVYITDDTLYAYTIGEGKLHVLLTLDQLNHELELGEGSEITRFSKLKFISDNTLYILANDTRYLYNLADHTGRKLQIPPGTTEVQIQPNGRVAFSDGSNIFIGDEKGKLIPISRDSVKGITNGITPYRNEFGMEHGFFWSPGGGTLAWYHVDQTRVEIYPLVDISTPIASYVPYRYPMAGRTMETTGLRLYSIQDDTVLSLAPPPGAGVYMTNIAWSPDEKTIYLQQLNRGQDTMRLLTYSGSTGEFKGELFMETHPKYVEPMDSVFPLKRAEGDFLYLSERSGYNHIYLYRAAEKKLEPLTSGDWDVTCLLGTDPSESLVYFMAREKSPLESHLYKLDRTKGEMVRLTRGRGIHQITFNSDMSLYIDRYSNSTEPGVILLANSEGEVLKELLNADNPIKDYTLGETEIGTVRGGEGTTDLYYKLTRPVDFDPAKKYPLVLYVYGGPHVQLITDSWMGRIDYLQQYLAQRGYASLIVDSRGSDNRGRDFEDAIFREQGKVQMEDNLAVVEYLSERSWIDTSRIGVHGWSYGGFMTLDLMLNYPGVFKVAVAGGAVTDWSMYEVMYGERYMDTPAENPEGYAVTNLIDQAGKLEGKLLMIHGAMDSTVVWQHQLRFVQACIKQDKTVDMFVYPGHEHNVHGKDRMHLTRMITEYFLEHL